MTLREYLEFRGITTREFAAMHGFSNQQVENWVFKRNTPKLPVAMKLKLKTKGKVKLEDMFSHEDDRRREEGKWQ